MRHGRRLWHQPRADGRSAQSGLVGRWITISRDGTQGRGHARNTVFIRPVYQDGTDRPSRFEDGVQEGENLLVDVFPNGAGPASPALRQASAFILDTTLIEDCLNPASAKDQLFARGRRSGSATLTRAERCALAGVTGLPAESVTEVLIDQLDWRVLWHFTGPGRHGVDLLFITPGNTVIAVEVKGTLRAGAHPATVPP